MACGVCVASCPARMDIPGYIKAVRDGDLETRACASSTRPIPSPRPAAASAPTLCEDACAIGLGRRPRGHPLAQALHRRPGGAVRLREVPAPGRARRRASKVAVVGAGPGGLSAAYYLALLGHDGHRLREGRGRGRHAALRHPRVPPALPRPGQGHRLHRKPGREDPARRDGRARTSALAELRAGLRRGLPVHRPARRPTGSTCPGTTTPAVLDGVAVLAAATRGEELGLGRRVAVVGGGNVAMDAARTALRHGAVRWTSSTAAARSTCPPIPRRSGRPRPRAPASSSGPSPLEVKDSGGRTAPRCSSWNEAEMVQKEPGKRPVPEPIPGAVVDERYDSIIAAIGQGPDLSYVDRGRRRGGAGA
ncbi:MAG: hypothetical protein MZV65_16005 [Chromatiales bacterium]|nr:hypothetical protein [Chromatiales bacterium]